MALCQFHAEIIRSYQMIVSYFFIKNIRHLLMCIILLYFGFTANISNYVYLDIYQIYEPKLLDTGGAVKNVCKFFEEKFILVLNSDTFWNSATQNDLLNILNHSNYNNFKCLLLLSKIKNTYGLKMDLGDFEIIKNKILRNKSKNKGLVYTGAQIIDTDVFDLFNDEVFSFNKVWDLLIKKKEITAVLTKSNILHLGNINGFSYLNTFNT